MDAARAVAAKPPQGQFRPMMVVAPALHLWSADVEGMTFFTASVEVTLCGLNRTAVIAKRGKTGRAGCVPSCGGTPAGQLREDLAAQ